MLALAALGVLIVLLPRLITGLYARPLTYPVEEAPDRKVAIVFGAGLRRDGSPTPVLRDRVEAAAQLYFSGKVEKLLMSGDNRFIYYNEPGSMRLYALELGIPEEAIVMDFAGRRTYDTCYRAKEIFKVNEAVLVTQGFHLPRALYTCNRLGLDAVGISADLRRYRNRSLLFWHIREIPATLVALWEVNFSRPVPVLGEPEPIFQTGN
jgi:SanA protein